MTLVSFHGDTIADDLCHDHLTQLQYDDEYFWDDFGPTFHEEEADVLSYYSEVEEGDFFAEDNYAEIDFAEDNYAEIDFAEDDYVEEDVAEDDSGGGY